MKEHPQEHLSTKDFAEAATEALTLTLNSPQESEAGYRLVVQDEAEVISRLRADGVYIFVNEAYCRFFGKAEAELIGKTWQPVVHADDIEHVMKKLGTLSPSHPLVTLENRVRAGDGEVHWMEFFNCGIFDPTGSLVEIQSVGRDITERKRAKHAAAEQLKLAEAFFHHSVSCIVVLDRNFNFLRVNEAYARACRMDISAFTGRNHFEMFPSDTKEIFDEVVRTRKPFHNFERSFEFPDQPERGVTWWEWTLVPILDGQGEVEYLVFSLNEVTERKRAQEIVEKSMRQVQALSERVMKAQQEERDRIAHELHDELGQTLTAMKVRLQLLEPYCVHGEADGHLNEALVIASRALEQIRGMALDLRPVGLEDLGLSVVLKSHLAKQADTAGWDAHFESALTARLSPRLKMACFRVAQEALTNVMRHARAKEVWVMLAMTAGKVMLTVRDDGAGFDASADPHFSSAGFGLIGMHERVRQMGGQLVIRSSPGRGTEVHATFPFEPDDGQPTNLRASARP